MSLEVIDSRLIDIYDAIQTEYYHQVTSKTVNTTSVYPQLVEYRAALRVAALSGQTTGDNLKDKLLVLGIYDKRRFGQVSDGLRRIVGFETSQKMKRSSSDYDSFVAIFPYSCNGRPSPSMQDLLLITQITEDSPPIVIPRDMYDSNIYIRSSQNLLPVSLPYLMMSKEFPYRSITDKSIVDATHCMRKFIEAMPPFYPNLPEIGSGSNNYFEYLTVVCLEDLIQSREYPRFPFVCINHDIKIINFMREYFEHRGYKTDHIVGDGIIGTDPKSN